VAEPVHALIIGLVRALADTEAVKSEQIEADYEVHLSFLPEECDGELKFWVDGSDRRLHAKVRWR
jgi:hypothetical protein